MNPAPPKLSSSIAPCAAIVLAAVAAGIAAFVYCFNPSVHQFYPVCQFHRLTGLYCPGCGGTRALYALLHGDWTAAFRDNALLVAGLPLAAARLAWFALNRWRGRLNGDFLPAKFLFPLLIVIGLFGVLRNLPAFAFLSP
ncbi:MAG TPA: DUF2752 domain-containing protein [Candidatus Acidoferrales bacterium]|nr:DUF2752 domain-containing protein [Candidatus Acidoferrales bacterium]